MEMPEVQMTLQQRFKLPETLPQNGFYILLLVQSAFLINTYKSSVRCYSEQLVAIAGDLDSPSLP
eukprot:1988940-Rhodomonas_salina.1